MLPSTAEVAFGGVIIYQRQRQLSLIQLLNARNRGRQKTPSAFREPAEPTEGSGGWWWWCGPCQSSAAIIILRGFNANPAAARFGALGLWLPESLFERGMRRGKVGWHSWESTDEAAQSLTQKKNKIK